MKADIKIAIWGYGKPLVNILPAILNSGIQVAYVRFDRMRADASSWIEQIEPMGIKVYGGDYPKANLDLIFVINYNKIIPEQELKETLFLNYHVGLLPKWRGNSANGWAVINGENYVGYTLHKVVPMLDAGPIHYQYKHPIILGETYFKARLAMDADLQEKIGNIIKQVIAAPEDYCETSESVFVYCSKFHPEDGDISTWQFTTEEILRRHYVFGPPLGTGLKFQNKGKVYDIVALSKVENFADSKGIPGGVVYFNNGSMWIKTLDTAISIDGLKCHGEDVNMHKDFMIGQRL